MMITPNTLNTWQKPFFIIAIGQAISLIGSSAVQFALIWWLAEETASPLIIGISGLVAFLPMAIFSPLAGVLADKYSRKTICILSDLSTAAAALVYAVLLHTIHLPVWSVLIVLGLRGISGTFQQPAIQAIIPQLVPADALVKANGWMQLMASGSFVLGPVIGALMYSFLSMPMILVTDVFGAVIASVTLGLVSIPPLQAVKKEHQNFLQQLQEGMEVYTQDRKLFALAIAQALCMFFFAPLSSFYPLMTSDYFALSSLYGSIVETTYAVGMMVSALLFSSVLKIRRKIFTAYLGLFGMGLATAFCGILPPSFSGWLIFAGICALMGASGNVHSIPMMAYMQETIAPEKMGRAFSLLTLMGSLTMPIGLLISSPIAEQIGVRPWFLIAGIGMLVSVLAVSTVQFLSSNKT